MDTLARESRTQIELGWGIVMDKGPDCDSMKFPVGCCVFYQVSTAIKFGAEYRHLRWLLDEAQVVMWMADPPVVAMDVTGKDRSEQIREASAEERMAMGS